MASVRVYGKCKSHEVAHPVSKIKKMLNMIGYNKTKNWSWNIDM